MYSARLRKVFFQRRFASRRALASSVGIAHATIDNPAASQAARSSFQSASDTLPMQRAGSGLYGPRAVAGRPRFGFRSVILSDPKRKGAPKGSRLVWISIQTCLRRFFCIQTFQHTLPNSFGLAQSTSSELNIRE